MLTPQLQKSNEEKKNRPKKIEIHDYELFYENIYVKLSSQTKCEKVFNN